MRLVFETQAFWKSKHVIRGAKDASERRYTVMRLRIGEQQWSSDQHANVKPLKLWVMSLTPIDSAADRRSYGKLRST